MTDILNENFDYDYNGTLLKEIFYKPTTETPMLSDFARIIPGSQFQIKVHLANPISNILKAGKGCGRTETGNGFELTNTDIKLDPMQMYVTECADDFDGEIGNYISEEALRTGLDRNDIGGTELEAIIDRLLQDGLRTDIFRIFSFGDKASLSDNYNQTDGLWTKTIAGVGTGCVNRAVDISSVLGDGDALSAIKDVYKGADNTLDQIPENMKHMLVTRSVFDNLVDSYESVSTGSDLQVRYLTDGIPTVSYRGVEVKKISFWDQSLLDVENPLNGTTTNLIMYTTKENHAIAVGDTADLNRIDGWYSKDDDEFKFASKMRMGYNYIHCDLTTVGY